MKRFGVIGNLINETKCKTIIVNGVEDHVHCFIGLKPVVPISELMKTVKAKSSKYINQGIPWFCIKATRERICYGNYEKLQGTYTGIYLP